MENNNYKIINGLKIDPSIFEFKFSCKCNGECCHYGVYTDLEESKTILNESENIKELMDDSQPKNKKDWFENPLEDSDFKSGIAVGTNVINGKCVFLDKQGLCVLQKLAIKQNEFVWKYKPLYCVLFPLTIWEGSLTIDYEHIDRLKHCNKNIDNNFTIFDFCKNELIFLLGEKGYKELLDYKTEYFETLNKNIEE
ncbi:MAG: hypothetical protein STSR0008_10870 [Ignavibacterium sp.]